MNKEIAINVLCTCLGFLIASSLYYGAGYFEECPLCENCREAERLERAEMYNPSIINSTNWINGVYRSSPDHGFYCIWTKDKSPSQISTYKEHEICHALIHADNEHFCNHNASSYAYRDYSTLKS